MVSSKDEERRRLKRRNLSYYLPIRNNDNQQIIGHLVDLSVNGLMIDSKRPIPTQQDFSLCLNLSENFAIKFVARTRWCRADPIQPYLYNVGFEIINISPADSEELKKIAKRYGTIENQQAAQ